MDLFSARRDGSNVRQLTLERGYDAEAAYSPDGRLIIFSSNRHAYAESLSSEDRKRLEADKSYFCELYRMNADGSDVRRLTHTPGYDGGPFFSPDGQRVIWRRFDEHGVIANAFSMKIDGTDVRQLTDFGCMSWAPYFHPSGELLHLHGEQARLRQLRTLHRRRRRRARTRPHHPPVLRRPAGLLARWAGPLLDREPDVRPEVPALPRPLESRGGRRALAAAPARIAGSAASPAASAAVTAPTQTAGRPPRPASRPPRSSDTWRRWPRMPSAGA
jgi:hypothetical protein